jgi:predicted protein tyrosine phosphatase
MNYSLYATRNQLMNISNQFQGNSPRVLFICSAGLLRSATAAHIFSADPYLWNTRTAGIDHAFSLNPVTEALLCWADYIFTMDTQQKNSIAMLFKDSPVLAQILERITVLNIPDIYPYRDPELIELLKSTVHIAGTPV